jgi:hypothetical protein
MIYINKLCFCATSRLVVSIIGIIAYNYYKLSKHGKDQGYEHLPMHSSNKLED